jgi:hypothetical protein
VSKIVSVSVRFAPADEIDAGSGHGADSGAEPGAHVNVTSTGSRYHPSRSGASLVMVAVSVGFVTVTGGADDAVAIGDAETVGDAVGEAETVGETEGDGDVDGVVVSLGAAPDGEPEAMTGLTSITTPAAPAADKTIA